MAVRKYPSALKDKFVVRMPDGLRAKVAQLSGESDASMNSEIVAAIEAHLEANARQHLLLQALQAQKVRSLSGKPKFAAQQVSEDIDYLDVLRSRD